MPLYPDAEQKIRANLALIAAKQRAPVVAIGRLTEAQFAAVNAVRARQGQEPLLDSELVFMGRHFYESRSKQGYTIDDMWLQLQSALAASAAVLPNSFQTSLEATVARNDGYGHMVHDRCVLECTQRRPRAEVFSVMPRGDGKM